MGWFSEFVKNHIVDDDPTEGDANEVVVVNKAFFVRERIDTSIAYSYAGGGELDNIAMNTPERLVEYYRDCSVCGVLGDEKVIQVRIISENDYQKLLRLANADVEIANFEADLRASGSSDSDAN